MYQHFFLQTIIQKNNKWNEIPFRNTVCPHYISLKQQSKWWLHSEYGLSAYCNFWSPSLTVSSCKLFFFFFFFLPQQLESTSLLGDSLPRRPSSSWPPICRDGGNSSSRRYDRFLRVQIQFSTICWQGEREAGFGSVVKAAAFRIIVRGSLQYCI